MAGQDHNTERAMKIGEFARRAGVSIRSIRYYEELELIRPERRSRGGFRLYGPENLKRLAVIGFLKEVGLSLAEIREILLAKKAAGDDRATVGFLLRIFNERLQQIESKINTLRELRKELRKAVEILRSCEHCGHDILLDAISCRDCISLVSRQPLPDTFQVILQ